MRIDTYFRPTGFPDLRVARPAYCRGGTRSVQGLGSPPHPFARPPGLGQLPWAGDSGPSSGRFGMRTVNTPSRVEAPQRRLTWVNMRLRKARGEVLCRSLGSP